MRCLLSLDISLWGGSILSMLLCLWIFSVCFYFGSLSLLYCCIIDCNTCNSSLQVHSLMCSELAKLVDRISNIFPEIEAARPRCSSGIQALCLLSKAIEKAKSLLQYCSESSKLYLVCIFGWFRIKSRCN